MNPWRLTFTVPTWAALACSTLAQPVSVDSIAVWRQQQSPTYLAHEPSLRAHNPDSLRIYWPQVVVECEPVLHGVWPETKPGGARDTITLAPRPLGWFWFVCSSHAGNWSCRSNEVLLGPQATVNDLEVK